MLEMDMDRLLAPFLSEASLPLYIFRKTKDEKRRDLQSF